ncbi:MAG: LysM peptidoglycan-binding domain-containing protein [Spirochaetota bacterium]|nr:LysM peptidoglycan-binding domain-containing protein [Spirochaetota bacterium]
MKTIKENTRWTSLEKSEYVIYLLAIFILISILFTFNYTSNNQLLEYGDFYRTGLSDEIVDYKKMISPVNHSEKKDVEITKSNNIKQLTFADQKEERKQTVITKRNKIQVIENQVVPVKLKENPKLNPKKMTFGNVSQKVREQRSLKSNMIMYQIKAGDYLNKIANEHQVTMNSLIKYNNIKNPNWIIAGSYLKIPKWKR